MAPKTAPTSAPPAEDRASRLPLTALCLGYFMVILDVTVVTVAVPSIGTALHGGVTALQWVVDGYTLAFAGLLLFCGGLGDRLGGRHVFAAGVVVFTLASGACGAAPTPAVLIAARLVQGAGAALMVPASLALLQAAYTGGAARARAFGVWGMVSGIAAGAGPVLGGVLTGAFGWRSVFLVNLPIGLAALALALRYVPSPPPASGRSAGLDVPAQAAGALSLTGLAAGLNEAGTAGWTHPLVLGAFAVSVLALAAFLLLERRSRAPMLPLRLFRAAEFSASAAIGVLLNLGFYGWLFAAPLYFQRVHHYSALRTGLALLPAMGVVAVSSALAGRVTARTGPRFPMVAGLAAGAAGLLGWLAAGTGTPYPVLIVPMAAVGFGTAFTMPAATAAVMRAVPEGNGGVASAVFNTARQAGSAVGVAVFGTLAAAGIVSGAHTGVIIAAAGFAAAALLAARFVRAA
ncbi:MFS transporter [Actinomadura sp. NTSP31]|uniref:MFS transporter n=1 Tax=Actinomadura sp. NTSP31 TaxID=1735447 RepID=UPI0035BEF13E